MQRWQCPIYNGTFKRSCLIKYELYINVFAFLNNLFSIAVSLRTCYETFKGTVMNRELPSKNEGSLKITLTVPLKVTCVISTFMQIIYSQKNVKYCKF